MSKSDAPGDAQWSLEVDADRIAWLTFDKPGASANSLSRAAMEQFDEWLTGVQRAGVLSSNAGVMRTWNTPRSYKP